MGRREGLVFKSKQVPGTLIEPQDCLDPFQSTSSMPYLYIFKDNIFYHFPTFKHLKFHLRIFKLASTGVEMVHA